MLAVTTLTGVTWCDWGSPRRVVESLEQLGPQAAVAGSPDRAGRRRPGEMRNHPLRTRPGRPYPLGATWDGAGVNFALFSDHATGVELCLFDPADPAGEAHRVPMVERTDQVWHVYLPEGRPGLLYGYRVDGPYEPAAGHRFNARKLLLDPYAQGDRRDHRVERRHLRLPRRRSRRRPRAGRSGQRAVRAEERRGGRRVHLGRRPAAQDPVAPDRDLRGARPGLHRPEPRESRRRSAGPTPASPTRPPSSTCAASA